MLDPNSRSLYTDALTPPVGMLFDYGVATTYSADPTLVLGIPLHLVLATTEDPESLLKDPITLYESLQRVTDRLHIFCQKGNIHVPAGSKALYVLLEKMLFEATAPGGGAFHPKIWVLRFIDPHDKKNILLRLIVLSRNLTRDQSWDVSLQLEGVPEEIHEKSRQLGEFIASLPEFCDAPIDVATQELIHVLGEQVSRVEWEVPEGFEDVEFHVIGAGSRSWTPASSESLVVISPFVSNAALRKLADTTKEPLALISRAGELDQLDSATRSLFKNIKILHEAAETEDGQDTTDDLAGEIGLHAKVYVYKAGQFSSVVLGSANATNAALVNGNNVEVLAELRGRWRWAGRPGDLIDLEQSDGLGSLLVDYVPTENEIDTDQSNREDHLKAAQKELISAGIEIHCTRSEFGWQLLLTTSTRITLDGIEGLRLRPITVNADQAVKVATKQLNAQGVMITVSATESVTSLIAFELDAGQGDRLAFVLNLPIEGLPDDRDRAILRTIIHNKAGFMRYLLLLLAMDGQMSQSIVDQFTSEQGGAATSQAFMDQVPLFEELVRAFSREPERIRKIGRIIKELIADEGGEDLLPNDFIELWQTFEEALEHKSNA